MRMNDCVPGGVPLMKENRQPATPMSTPDRAKTISFTSQFRTPTAEAPSGTWPTSTEW